MKRFPFIKKIMARINQSTIGDNNVSSVRIQSYIILLPILIMTAIFLIIEIWDFIYTISSKGDYTISTEIIVIFGMLLSHHLAVMFSRKNSQSISDLTGNNNPLNESKVTNKKKIEDITDDMDDTLN